LNVHWWLQMRLGLMSSWIASRPPVLQGVTNARSQVIPLSSSKNVSAGSSQMRICSSRP
jgi:hypothetical protein